MTGGEADRRAQIAALWREAGLGAGTGLTLQPAARGGNNLVFIAEEAGRRAVAKCYFTQGAGRDRLDGEWRFLSYARDVAGAASVPAPLARDDKARIALHEFRAGRRPDGVEPGMVEQAARLLRTLNGAEATDLPLAADACFTLAEQLALIEARLARLAGAEEPASLVGRMTAYWGTLRPALIEGYAALDLSPTDELPEPERCISPSDFGFHNALAGEDGTLSFVDFEYAGWDDPAKTLCDFFLQPAVPVDEAYFEAFFATAFGGRPGAGRLRERTALLRPLFALKWCCIMLNPFLPDLAARARFAQPDGDDLNRRRERLDKAWHSFNILTGTRH